MSMQLWVGLGNPGNEYKGNRHNVGFMVMDQLAEDNYFPAFKEKFKGLYTQGLYGGRKIILLKPQTYMNDSGQSVRAAADFYKIEPENIIVFYDELDIDPGRVKIKQGGGTGGHNGIKSIDKHLGDKDYWRVRLGIGHPGDKNRVSGYVLSDFSKEEQKWLPFFLDSVTRYADILLGDNKDDFMTRVAESSF